MSAAFCTSVATAEGRDDVTTESEPELLLLDEPKPVVTSPVSSVAIDTVGAATTTMLALAPLSSTLLLGAPVAQRDAEDNDVAKPREVILDAARVTARENILCMFSI